MRNLICALMLSAVALPAWAGQVLGTPVLASVDNFRDVAGVASAHGGSGQADAAGPGSLKPGVVYRSNVLLLSSADQATITRLGIGEDIDLRTPYEIKRQPDVLPPGVTYVNVNIFGVQALNKPDMSSAATASRQMEVFYQNFVTSPVERQGIRTALLDVAQSSKPVVFHCSAGKDRTGWLAAVLQSIAGVSQAQIMQDYLASNAYTAPRVQATLAKIPAAQRPAVAEMLSVQPQYLNAGLQQVHQHYGSMQAYLTQGLGLTPVQITTLRIKLTEN